MLFVNGRARDDHPVSAVSAFSARYIRFLHLRDVGVVLNWFCGYFRHHDVYEMTLNLLGQLLSLSTADLPIPRLESKLNLAEAVGLFQTCILRQLRETPVFCFIDSITHYEDKTQASDTKYLLDGLATLAASTKSELHGFKLLVTSATRCRSMRLLGRTVQSLDVP